MRDLSRYIANKNRNFSWNISPKTMNQHILVSHLASLMLAKLILGRFRDVLLPDFSRFPAGSDDYHIAFFCYPRHG